MYKRVTLGIVLLVFAAMPFFVSAQSDNLQAQLDALIAQFKQLQTQAQAPASDSTSGTSLPAADDYGTTPSVRSTCPNLSVTMSRGSRDATTGGQVTDLQIYLSDRFNVDEEALVSGYFGKLTESYVVRFQQEQGLPSVGIVGQLTRARIASLCTPGVPQICPAIAYVKPECSSLQHLERRFGTNGCEIAPVCVANSTPLVCGPLTIVDCAPGYHGAPIEYDDRGCEKPTQCVPDSVNGAPVISGVSGPSSLNVGQSGTWTVNASVPNVPGAQLRYAATWGDERWYAAQAIQQAISGTIKTTATFTHSYTNAGTYRPIFTVTNDVGSAQTSASVLVGDEQACTMIGLGCPVGYHAERITGSCEQRCVPDASEQLSVSVGASSVAQGSQLLISWSVSSMPDNSQVVLWLKTSSGQGFGLIRSGNGRTGSMNWTIPICDRPELAHMPTCGKTGSAITSSVPAGTYYVQAEIISPASACWSSTTNCAFGSQQVLATAKSAIFTVTSGSLTTASITAAPSSGTAPLMVKLTGKAPQGRAISIDYGDGITEPLKDRNTACPALGDRAQSTNDCFDTFANAHTYTTGGTYTVRLLGGTLCTLYSDNGIENAFDSCLPQSLASTNVTVTGAAASFAATPTSGTAPLTVTFSGTVGGAGYSIDFGDGSERVQGQCIDWCPPTMPISLSHTYTKTGTYTATLYGTDYNTCPNSDMCAAWYSREVAKGTVTITVSAGKEAWGKPRGWLDVASCETGIQGWTQDVDTPNQSNDVHFYIDGIANGTSQYMAGYTTASNYRADLCTAIGSCNHGFVWTVPAKYHDGKTHTIYAYGIDTTIKDANNALLAGSPKSFTCTNRIACPDYQMPLCPTGRVMCPVAISMISKVGPDGAISCPGPCTCVTDGGVMQLTPEGFSSGTSASAATTNPNLANALTALESALKALLLKVSQ